MAPSGKSQTARSSRSRGNAENNLAILKILSTSFVSSIVTEGAVAEHAVPVAFLFMACGRGGIATEADYPAIGHRGVNCRARCVAAH